jgi:hypothetical protein
MKYRYNAYALAFSLCSLAPTVCDAAPRTISFPRFELAISESRTAQLFHIVDQLSLWDQYAHKQYARWAAKSLPLDDEDRRFLQQHVELRHRYGWGSALEKAFLVDEPLDTAARDAVQNGLLTEAEATKERDILRHFAPRLAPLMQQQKPLMDRFIRQLNEDRGRLAPTIAELIAFCEIRKNINVPVFLVANPEDKEGGGEGNAGRLVLEVPSPDPRSFLLHEALHFLLVSHQEQIRTAATAAGLPFGLVNEAVAYAFAPGLTNDGTPDDLLADVIVEMHYHGTKATDSYLQFYSMAMVIRPVLREALRHHETFSTFLPKAIRKWKDTVPQPAG